MSLDAWVDRINRLGWEDFPSWVGRRSLLAHELLVDSRSLTAWPPVAAALISGSALLGLLLGLFHPGQLYTGSTAVVALLVVLGAAGATAGSWFCLTFLPADLLIRPSSWAAELSKPGLLVADLLAVLLLTVLPYTAHRLAHQTLAWRHARMADRVRRDWWLAGSLSAVYGLLVWAWVQSVPALIRPAYTWAGGPPDSAVVQPVQSHLWLLVVLAALAGGSRGFVEWYAAGVTDPTDGGRWREVRVSTLSARRQAREFPLWGRTGLRALAGVVLGAGLLGSALQALIIFAALVIGTVAQFRLGAYDRWARSVLPWPAAFRLFAVLTAAAVLGAIILSIAFVQASTLLPVLAATACGLLLAALLLPEREQTTLAEEETR